MIILEGSDCVGKTTVARLIAECGWEYHHMTAPGDGFDHLGFYVGNFHEGRVWDRYHLGTLVYGHLLKLSDPCNLHVLEVVRDWLAMRAFTVVLTASLDHIEQNFEHASEMYTLEHAIQANIHYIGLNDNWFDMRINICGKTPQQVAEAIIDAYV